jgi:hypothetical protein
MRLPKSDPLLGQANSYLTDSAQPCSIPYPSQRAYASVPEEPVIIPTGSSDRNYRPGDDPRNPPKNVDKALTAAFRDHKLPVVSNPNATRFSSTKGNAPRAYALSVTLTERQKEIAAGGILADMHANRTAGGTKLQIRQGWAQLWFVWFLFKELMSIVWVPTPSTETYKVNMGTWRLPAPVVQAYYFHTWRTPALDWLHMANYTGSVKTYQEGFITEHLTVLGFAVMYMGDGHLANNSTPTLCLHNYSRAELETMNRELNAKFGLNGRVRHVQVSKNGMKYGIVYTPADRPFFRELDLLPIFSYKVPKN